MNFVLVSEFLLIMKKKIFNPFSLGATYDRIANVSYSKGSFLNVWDFVFTSLIGFCSSCCPVRMNYVSGVNTVCVDY